MSKSPPSSTPLHKLTLAQTKMLYRQAKLKQSMSMPLTPVELNLLAMVEEALLARRTESLVSEGNQLHYKKSGFVDHIFAGAKARREMLESSPIKPQNGASYLGSVDEITAGNWATECGAAIGTKEWNQYAKKQLLDGKYALFAGR